MADNKAMRTIRILVANEPRSYREAIARALQDLRPRTEVNVVAPDLEALDQEILSHAPDIVVCACATDAVRTVGAWIELSPDGQQFASLCIDGRIIDIAGLELSTLALVIDRVEFIAQKS